MQCCRHFSTGSPEVNINSYTQTCAASALHSWSFATMANNQLLNVCAAIRNDLARQAQDLAAIRADCKTAADSMTPGVAALKDAISGLAGDGEAGRRISWGLSGVGAVQADSACLMLMLWALGKGARWIVITLLVNLVLSPPNGACWAVYLLATWTGRWLEDLQRRFPWMASCCGGAN
jgi:hypothetical protein